MDQTPEHLATFAMLAELGRVSGTARNRADEDPSSLLDMLLNPEFIPPDLSVRRDIRRDHPTLYDDLPPLEEEADTRGSRVSSGHPVEDHLAPLEDDEPPSLETDDDLPTLGVVSTSHSHHATHDRVVDLRMSTNTSVGTSGGVPSITRTTSATAASSSSHPPLVDVVVQPLAALARSSPTTATWSTSTTAPEDDTGSESDSSLPSLQSVSDSSSDDDIYLDDSDSDWDDEESMESDEGSSIAQIIENAERSSAEQSRNLPTTLPNTFTEPEPEVDFDPERLTNTIQTYRELLERARGLIPDLDTSFEDPPNWLADLTMRLAGVDNDPKRAETLLAGMQTVPDDLVRRYENLRTADGGDTDGCAICRDDLLDKSNDASRVLAVNALLPFHPETDCIIAFPCAGKHLFHKECLSPWLARKTTCPTCRFDVDPLSLTLRITRGVHETAPEDHQPDLSRPTRVWQPPQVESLGNWLDAEERSRATGVPRERPPVIMPQYRSPSPSNRPSGAPLRPTRPAGTPLSEFFDAPLLDWGYNPITGNSNMTAAFRELHAMREHFMQVADQQRAAVLAAARERRTEVPTRPLPVAPPEASPSMLRSPNPWLELELPRSTTTDNALPRVLPPSEFHSNSGSILSVLAEPQPSPFTLAPRPFLDALTGSFGEIEGLRGRHALEPRGHPQPVVPGSTPLNERITQLRASPIVREPPPDHFDLRTFDILREPPSTNHRAVNDNFSNSGTPPSSEETAQVLSDNMRAIAVLRQRLNAVAYMGLPSMTRTPSTSSSAPLSPMEPGLATAIAMQQATHSIQATLASSTALSRTDPVSTPGGRPDATPTASSLAGTNGHSHLSSSNPVEDLD